MMEFTVMGEVANLAARVEGLARQHLVDVALARGDRPRSRGAHGSCSESA